VLSSAGDSLISTDAKFSAGGNADSHAGGHYVLLFDIDGTLIDSKGAGGSALLKAAREVFSRTDIQPVLLHGRTDRGIMAELLESAGIAATPANLKQLSERYVGLLQENLKLCEGLVLPGVFELLNQLASDPRCHLGIVTGNMLQSAQIKLDHFRLWDYFKFGAYGHDAPQRRDLCDPAWNSIRQYATTLPEELSAELPAKGDLPSQNVIIIGDTVLDVDLALTMNVRCLAVCTGGCDATTLKAAGAHHVARDLTETEQLLRWFFSTNSN